MKKTILTMIIILASLYFSSLVLAENNLAEKLSGKILLQVESHGEAWYVNPADYKKYYLGRPADAFNLMQELSIGITNEDLEKIPVGLLNAISLDDDGDGLSNLLEESLGTNPQMADSDNDGYDDKIEIENNHNPLGVGRLNIDAEFTKQNLGKIFLQIEKLGQAWYVNPADKKRYYLERPADAFSIMRYLSLGITDNNLSQITIGYLSAPPLIITPPTEENVLYSAANAIRSGKIDEAVAYFTPELQKSAEYSLNALDDDGRLMFANIFSNTALTSSNENKKVYSTEVYFSMGGYKVNVDFEVEKQEDGTWLISKV